MSGGGDRLPDEIVLTRQEAADLLFLLDDALAAALPGSSLARRLNRQIEITVDKFMPDLRDL